MRVLQGVFTIMHDDSVERQWFVMSYALLCTVFHFLLYIIQRQTKSAGQTHIMHAIHLALHAGLRVRINVGSGSVLDPDQC